MESYRMVWWFGDVREGAAADRHSTMRRASGRTVGDDADSNHHFRATKHRVLDMLLGQSKLIITFGGRAVVHGVCARVWRARRRDGGPSALSMIGPGLQQDFDYGAFVFVPAPTLSYFGSKGRRGRCRGATAPG